MTPEQTIGWQWATDKNNESHKDEKDYVLKSVDDYIGFIGDDYYRQLLSEDKIVISKRVDDLIIARDKTGLDAILIATAPKITGGGGGLTGGAFNPTPPSFMRSLLNKFLPMLTLGGLLVRGK